MRKLFLNKRHSILNQSIIEWYQLTTGVEEPLLAKPTKLINYTSSIWFQDTIDFLYKHNISIFTKDFLTIKIQQKNDKCIMKEIPQWNLSKTSLIQINSCRIYLQAFPLSDMLDTNSKQVTQDFIKGITPVKQTSSYMWPNQLKPLTNAWKLWKKIITSTFKLTSNYNLPINLQLSN